MTYLCLEVDVKHFLRLPVDDTTPISQRNPRKLVLPNKVLDRCPSVSPWMNTEENTYIFLFSLISVIKKSPTLKACKVIYSRGIAFLISVLKFPYQASKVVIVADIWTALSLRVSIKSEHVLLADTSLKRTKYFVSASVRRIDVVPYSELWVYNRWWWEDMHFLPSPVWRTLRGEESRRMILVTILSTLEGRQQTQEESWSQHRS